MDNDKITTTPNFKISGNVNQLIDKIYKILDETGIKYINVPKNLIGDKSCISPFEFHFCKPYYEYIKRKIIDFNDSGAIKNNEAELLKCETEIHNLYNAIFCSNILNSMEKKLGNKDVVLIAKTKLFADMFLKKYGRSVLKYIYYDENSDAEQIVENVKILKKENHNYIFCMPEIFRHENQIFTMLFEAGLSPNFDFFIYQPEKVSLFSFTGLYEDIFNNYIVTEGVNNFNIYGLASQVEIKHNIFLGIIDVNTDGRLNIGKGFIADKDTIIRIWPGAKINIGEVTQFVSSSLISSHISCLIEIGNNCLFSLHEMILAGNGHSIFEFDEGKWKKCPDKQNIIIGNHVWVGYRCHIIGGADIGDGCIIGAGSLVNKKIPNNCIAAGVPAKVVKKNRAWTRNLYLHELEHDINVYKNFANITTEE